MIIYLVWATNPIGKNEFLVGWRKSENEAKDVQRAHLVDETRIENHFVNPDDITLIRKTKLTTTQYMSDNIAETVAKTKCQPEMVVLMESDLQAKINRTKKRIMAGTGIIYDDEIDKYLFYKEKGAL